jgi:hypothetical protein
MQNCANLSYLLGHSFSLYTFIMKSSVCSLVRISLGTSVSLAEARFEDFDAPGTPGERRPWGWAPVGAG